MVVFYDLVVFGSTRSLFRGDESSTPTLASKIAPRGCPYVENPQKAKHKLRKQPPAHLSACSKGSGTEWQCIYQLLFTGLEGLKLGQQC